MNPSDTLPGIKLLTAIVALTIGPLVTGLERKDTSVIYSLVLSLLQSELNYSTVVKFRLCVSHENRFFGLTVRPLSIYAQLSVINLGNTLSSHHINLYYSRRYDQLSCCTCNLG